MNKFDTLYSVYASLFGSNYDQIDNLLPRELDTLHDSSEIEDIFLKQVFNHASVQIDLLPAGKKPINIFNFENMYIRKVLGEFAEENFKTDAIHYHVGYDDNSNLDLILDKNGAHLDNNETVVGWSGGMDSLCTALWVVLTQPLISKMKLVNVDYSGPYNAKERVKAREAAVKLKKVFEKCGRYIDLDYVELDVAKHPMNPERFPLGYIMPARNGFIALSLLKYISESSMSCAPTIYMTGHYRSLEGQYSGAVDKNYHFFMELGNLATQGLGVNVQIASPFLGVSKEEMLKMTFAEVFLRDRVTSSAERAKTDVAAEAFFEAIEATVSCYHPEHDRCGDCQSCFKRWIALQNSLPTYTETYHSPIEQSEFFAEFTEREAKKGR